MPPDPNRVALISVIDKLLAIAEENRKGPPLEPQELAEVQTLDARLYALCKQTELSLPACAEPDYGELLPGSRLAYYPEGPSRGADGVGYQGGIRLVATREWRQAMLCLREATAMQLPEVGQSRDGTRPNGAPAPPAAGPDEAGKDTACETREQILQGLEPAVRKAYLSYEYAQSKAGKQLQDQEAHQRLSADGIPENDGDCGELTHYDLPSLDTWARHLRTARNALGEQKYTRRAGRSTGRSIVRNHEIAEPNGHD